MLFYGSQIFSLNEVSLWKHTTLSVVPYNLLVSTNHLNGRLMILNDLQIEINNGFATTNVKGTCLNIVPIIFLSLK